MTAKGLFLQWEGKRRYRQRIPTPRLLQDIPKLSVGDASPNMIIEGDNLQVLASLRSQYASQVDVIYIDPPYNLGKDDFRYSDRRFLDPDADDSDAVYVSNEDGGKHTKWLNFMAPRLYMLREILHGEHGVIFVSINDVELYRLGMLMNEIFGEENHVGTLIWKGSTDNNPTQISIEHEYILCYAKNKDGLSPVWSARTNDVKQLMLDEYESIKSETDNIAEIQKRFRDFIRQDKASLEPLTHYNLIDERGPYTGSRKVHNPGKNGYFYDIKHPVTKKPCRVPARGYRYPEDAMRNLIDSDRIMFGADETQIVQIKVYLGDYAGSLKSVINIDARTGQNVLADLFDGNREVFRNPKPVELVELLLDYSTTPHGLVLDAFAGSGTTAHAVLNLNNSDGGQRRFILIEEGRGADKFCETLTAQRVRRAIRRYKYKDGFTFYRTGQRLDRKAIVSLERDALASLICQSDETGRGKGITRLSGYSYLIGRNGRAEGICLVWNGNTDSEVTKAHLQCAAKEVSAAGLKRPFRIYGTFCRVGDTTSWRFCQIPDEILAQLNIDQDIGDD